MSASVLLYGLTGEKKKQKKPRVWRERAGKAAWWHTLKIQAKQDGWLR